MSGDNALWACATPERLSAHAGMKLGVVLRAQPDHFERFSIVSVMFLHVDRPTYHAWFRDQQPAALVGIGVGASVRSDTGVHRQISVLRPRRTHVPGLAHTAPIVPRLAWPSASGTPPISAIHVQPVKQVPRKLTTLFSPCKLAGHVPARRRRATQAARMARPRKKTDQTARPTRRGGHGEGRAGRSEVATSAAVKGRGRGMERKGLGVEGEDGL